VIRRRFEAARAGAGFEGVGGSPLQPMPQAATAIERQRDGAETEARRGRLGESAMSRL